MDEIQWSPDELLKASGSYWTACTIHAGVKLDVFTPLSEGPLNAADLAKLLRLDERALAMLLDALSSLDLIMKSNDQYCSTKFAQEFLNKNASGYLGHIIQHHHHLVESWGHLDEAVKRGQPVRPRVSHESEVHERESFLLGMFNLASMLAPYIAQEIDMSDRKHLLDLGGGPGTYAIYFCLQNPNLKATVFDLPSTRHIAHHMIRKFKLDQRINFAPGDFHKHPLPGSYDIAWLSHVLHSEGESGCVKILEKTVASLEPEGILMVQEFVLDDTRSQPLFPALFSLNMLLGTPEGKAYTETEIKSQLSSAGLENVKRLPLNLPNGAGVIVANKPG